MLFFLVINAAPAAGSNYKMLSVSDGKHGLQQGDSIMRNVIEYAEQYRTEISRYEAEIYIKGETEVLKHNFLMRFAHHLLPVNAKKPDIFFEMVSQSRFNAPNSYIYHFEAINGTHMPSEAKQQEALTFLNFNVYSPTIYNESIIMPVAREAFKFYSFHLDSIERKGNGQKIYKIHFMPKWWSQKLIYGDLYVCDESWLIDRIDINGRFSFAEFNLNMTFRRGERHFILPQQADLSLQYHIAGNHIVSRYHTAFQYKDIEWVEENRAVSRNRSFDLTGYYHLLTDTVPILRDSNYWRQKRDVPLTQKEMDKYEAALTLSDGQTDSSRFEKYLRLTQKLTNTVNLNYKTTRLKYSGILNPFQMGYSGRNGITYRQRLRMSKTFDRDRQLRFNPEIGYVFKRKELFFRVGGEWEYSPERMGTVSINIGNSNQGYSSRIMGEINEQLKDSAFNFDNLNLKYFKHYYLELRHQTELFNGFRLFGILSYHLRVPSEKSSIDPGDEVNELITGHYKDFMLSVGFSYTPNQYYWFDGHRKEYLYSSFPTFSFEFGRAIPHIFNSSGNYGRIEADVHQSISLGLARKFNYHVGGGFYTAQKSTYFADFRYFTRQNFPDSWGDEEFGGVFHQLRGEWFNASDKYLQIHLMYESPFILSRLFKMKSTRYILSERFYLSQLRMPVKPSYTEIGYGFGNHLFNVAAFIGFDKLNYDGIGFKFAFELFQ